MADSTEYSSLEAGRPDNNSSSRRSCSNLVIALSALSIGLLVALIVVSIKLSHASSSSSSSSVTPAPHADVAATLSSFFSMFVVPDCSIWSNLFLSNATFYHPIFPSGVSGSTALLQFCQTNQQGPGLQLWRQDGDMRITNGPNGQQLVLVPYLYTKSVETPSSRFINSGWEVISLVPSSSSSSSASSSSGQKQIAWAVEIFNRNAVPFVWGSEVSAPASFSSSPSSSSSSSSASSSSPSSSSSSSLQLHAINNATTTLIQSTLNQFFSLFVTPCASWAALFSPTATFYHPLFPEGVTGTTALTQFCETNQQSTKLQLFRQDGDMSITASGVTGQYHVTCPYVYSSASAAPSTRFANSGFEAFDIRVDAEGKTAVIAWVIEFFNRASVPFVWPDT